MAAVPNECRRAAGVPERPPVSTGLALLVAVTCDPCSVNRFEALGDLLGHRVKVEKKRVNGRVTHYWSVCSCGYESNPGKSSIFAMNSGIGHVKRVADALRRSGELEKILEDSGVSLPRVVGGRG